MKFCPFGSLGPQFFKIGFLILPSNCTSPQLPPPRFKPIPSTFSSLIQVTFCVEDSLSHQNLLNNTHFYGVAETGGVSRCGAPVQRKPKIPRKTEDVLWCQRKGRKYCPLECLSFQMQFLILNPSAAPISRKLTKSLLQTRSAEPGSLHKQPFMKPHSARGLQRSLFHACASEVGKARETHLALVQRTQRVQIDFWSPLKSPLGGLPYSQ